MWWFFNGFAASSSNAALATPQSLSQTILRNFLLSILPAGIEVVQAQDNRVPEPQGDDFVVITQIRQDRLATNIDNTADVLFDGSITGSILTVYDTHYGEILLNSQLFSPNVLAGTKITAFLTGNGGIGMYQVSQSQTVGTTSIAAGNKTAIQEIQFTYQLDVHGPNSADNTTIITTLFRDEYATDFFSQISSDVSPLYADDGRQLPFVNDQQQIENRWVIEAQTQVNAKTILPQQFFVNPRITPVVLA